ncbi:hypothetical protein PAGU2595_028790 [Lysobacter xanthus]
MAARNLSEVSRATVEAIVASPRVAMYNVGITMSPDRRRRQYALYSTPRAWNHMAFLAYGLTLQQAQKLEMELFEHCAKAPPRSQLAKKYSPVKEGAYRRSAGGRADDGEASYSVYVAWCEPGER